MARSAPADSRREAPRKQLRSRGRRLREDRRVRARCRLREDPRRTARCRPREDPDTARCRPREDPDTARCRLREDPDTARCRLREDPDTVRCRLREDLTDMVREDLRDTVSLTAGPRFRGSRELRAFI
ncbi:MAG: hypothetical protein HFI64_05175 [Lachnospiraceae bacterium]|nr:hypothetical protein [Lachnospiraceae bacterium]